MSTYIIAEAGVNHNGSLDMALALVDAAKQTGADCVKFQTFILEHVVTREAPTAAYQQQNTRFSSQYEMLKALELSYQDFLVLRAHCRAIGIDFLSTAFDMESVEFLDSLALPQWKIPSGEITNYPYLRRIGGTGKPVILSTGMSTLPEIERALAVLRDSGCAGITLMHCTTEYPAPYEDVHLRAMEMMRDAFGLEVGYSDHTRGIEVAIAAVAMGATVIEKHFTLNRDLDGPDHKASLEPAELADMVRAIRHVESALGVQKKEPSPSELENRIVARKSIVAARDIAAGEVLGEDNLTVKRPGDGLSPMRWPEVLGRKAAKHFAKDEQIVL